jgi:vanillate O-demethylase ferredoxin subunit
MPRLLVRSVCDAARDIRAYELVDPAGEPLKPFKAGSHIEIQLPGGYKRQYSLCNDPAETHRYLLAVLREKESRGGSQAFYDRVSEGDLLDVSSPRNNFPLDQRAMHFTLIAGGIGVTPLLSMAHKLKALRKAFDFHLCARSEDSLPFRKEFETLVQPDHLHVHITDGDPSRRLDVNRLLEKPVPMGLIYCCGPQNLMDAVGQAACNWRDKNVRFEIFTPRALDGSDRAFNVRIASTGQVIHVDSTTTILAALRQNGISHPFSCEVGLCRTCVTRYSDAEVEHRDQDVLSRTERQQQLTICVSRCLSGELVLDI